MFDTRLRVQQSLERIEDSIMLIIEKSKDIQSANDFLISSDGMFVLSGICMQLIFIGENVKVIDSKTNHTYLTNYPEIPWVEIMGLRDIIAHEYHRIDTEEIFCVIKKDLPRLLSIVQTMKREITRL